MGWFNKCNCTSKLTEEDRVKAWLSGFEMGVSKTWDQLVPYMTANADLAKKKLFDEAVNESIKRMSKK